jgi:hypothetical protein
MGVVVFDSHDKMQTESCRRKNYSMMFITRLTAVAMAAFLTIVFMGVGLDDASAQSGQPYGWGGRYKIDAEYYGISEEKNNDGSYVKKFGQGRAPVKMGSQVGIGGLFKSLKRF